MLAAIAGLFLQRRGKRGRARTFGEIVRIGPVGADGGRDLVIADLHDTRSAPGGDREDIRIAPESPFPPSSVATPSASVLPVAVLTGLPAANDSA